MECDMDFSRKSGNRRTSGIKGAGSKRGSGMFRPRKNTSVSTSVGGTGHRVRQHNIRFNNRPNPRGIFARYDSRTILLIAASIVVLFLLIFGIVGCVRGCAPKPVEKPANEWDARVAGGVSEKITDELGAVLDNNKKVSWIAKHADQYSDDRIIEFALREPEALDFIRALPSAQKRSTSYGEEVERGNFPALVTYDERWGYIDYAGLPLGVSGSGPTVFSIAYMGLTGKNDQTPADIARLSAEKGYDSGDEFTTAELFTSEADDLGLICSQLALSEDSLVTALWNNNVVICQVRADTLTPDPHWVIVTGLYENGAARVIDPTCAAVTAREWDVATISSMSNTLYALGRGEVSE